MKIYDDEGRQLLNAPFNDLSDTDGSNFLTLTWNEDDSADRILNLKVQGADRTLDLNESLTIGDGHDGTLTFSAASKTLTVEDTAIVSQDYSSDSTTVTLAGLALSGNLTLAANSITGTSVDINNAEMQQLSNIGTATISSTQWGYLGACGAGGGQLMANLSTGESTQLEAIGATTISAAQWGYLGACAAGGGQLLAALTEAESTQIEAIGATTISAAQWGYLGGTTANGGALIDAADYAAMLALLSGTATAEFLFNTQQIGGIVDPTTDQQAATKKYVDDNVGAATLAALTDTTISGPADLDLLQYDNGTSKWVDRTFAEAGVAVASHAMATHSDEDSYNINTSGTLTAGNATLGTIGSGIITAGPGGATTTYKFPVGDSFENVNTGSNSAMSFNYDPAGDQSLFRDFHVFNGKRVAMLSIDGSASQVNIPVYLVVGAYAGGAKTAGDIVARRAATTGAYYFGDGDTEYLYFDGTNFLFGGGVPIVPDHGTAATDMVVNVCYGTGAAPAANTTTIGSLYIKYVA